MSEISKITDYFKNGVPLYLTNSDTGQFMSFNDVEKSVTPLKNAVLEEYLRPGDIVMMNAEKEHVKEKIPNGTFGVVTGYYRYRRSVGYNELWCSKVKNSDGSGVPGIIEGNGAAQISWINGEISQGHAGDIYNITDDRGFKREGFAEFKAEYEKGVLVGALPDLPVWPDDTVQLNKVFYSDPGSCGETDLVKVERIDYNDHGTFCNDGVTPFPIYGIRPLNEGGPSMSVREYISAQEENDRVLEKWGQASAPVQINDDVYIVKVAERGNYWAWFNDKSKLQFDTFRQEVQFYKSLGLMIQLESPSGGYGWTLEEAMLAMNSGEACYFVRGGTFGRKEVWGLPSLPDVAKRLRDHQLFAREE
jgi:hypothetical protein